MCLLVISANMMSSLLVTSEVIMDIALHIGNLDTPRESQRGADMHVPTSIVDIYVYASVLMWYAKQQDMYLIRHQCMCMIRTTEGCIPHLLSSDTKKDKKGKERSTVSVCIALLTKLQRERWHQQVGTKAECFHISWYRWETVHLPSTTVHHEEVYREWIVLRRLC